MARIAVYTICLNEEQFAERWCATTEEADYALVADTGSTDRTRDILMEHAGDSRRAGWLVVPPITIKPWRFDMARNAALAMLPDDIDWCVVLDMDETLSPGWRQAIEAVAPAATRIRHPYQWSPDLRFDANRVHRRHGYAWKYPCHETLYTYGGAVEREVTTADLLITQTGDPKKSRAQYLPLLADACVEYAGDPRPLFYYGRELGFHRRYAEQVETLLRYLAIPGQWDVEVSAVHLWLAAAYDALGQPELAAMHAHRAPEVSARPICWAISAQWWQRDPRGPRWPDCYRDAIEALRAEPDGSYLADNGQAELIACDNRALAAFQMRDHETVAQAEAVEYGERALQLAPDDARLIENLRWYRGERR